MGKVLRASHLYLAQSVAIKVLLPHMADSASTVTRFLREAQATVNLKNEHIARVIDVGTIPASHDTPPTPFMIMEYLDGNDLNQILRHHGPQAPAVVCDLMLQACEGMAEAHATGIVHRDIKPSNFFITRRPDGTMLLKILDFGISKTQIGVTDLTGTEAVLGTPAYMAPEQMKTSRDADARSDIWSIGVVMYQLITGRPPFAGETYAELVLKVSGEQPSPMMVPLPPGLGEVILRCLEKNPMMRPQNVGELARQLAPYATDPVGAASSAQRTTRTLQVRNSAQGIEGLPLTSAGGRMTPTPLSPSQLTPRSQFPTGNPSSHNISSLSHGRGQVTHRVRSSRGWVIAGAAALTLIAGAGGFVASRMLGDKDTPATPAAAQQPAPPPPTPPTETKVEDPGVTKPPPPVATELPPPTPTITEPATPEKPAKTVTVAKPKPAKPDVMAKPRPDKTDKPKPVATKPKTTKPKTTKPRKSGDDDLFDTRK
jgi:serine/threonine-protein kinase